MGTNWGVRHVCRLVGLVLVIFYSGCVMHIQMWRCGVSGRSLQELEAERERLCEELAAVGDFRRGSLSANFLQCRKPNCVCARPDHPRHGPRFLWTRTVSGRRTRGRQLVAGEVDKVRAEISNYHRFARLSDELVEVNEAICEMRPPDQVPIVSSTSAAADEKGGSGLRSPRRSTPARPRK